MRSRAGRATRRRRVLGGTGRWPDQIGTRDDQNRFGTSFLDAPLERALPNTSILCHDDFEGLIGAASFPRKPVLSPVEGRESRHSSLRLVLANSGCPPARA